MAQRPQRDIEKDRWGKDQWDILNELLKERGIVSFALLDAVGEGEYLATGLETISWLILTPDEKIRDVWLGWDPGKASPDGEIGYYTFQQFKEVEVEYEKGKPGYLKARKQLNLPLTEEQERILREWEEEQKKYQT